MNKLISYAVRIIGSSGFARTVLASLLGSAAIRIAGMGFGFLIAIQLARSLGPSSYGIYGIAMSFVAISAVMSDMGSSRTAVRDVSAGMSNRDWSLVKTVIGWSNKTTIKFSITISGLLFSLNYFINDVASSLHKTIAVACILIPITALLNVQSGIIRGFHKVPRAQMLDGLLRPAIYSALLLVASNIAPFSPELAMGLGGISIAISLAVGFALLQKLIPEEVRQAKLIRTTGWINRSSAMAYSETVRVLQPHSTILLLGAFSTDSMVGAYRAATSLLVLLGTAETIINLSSAPFIAKLHAESNREKQQKLVSILCITMFIGTAVVSYPFLAYGGETISLLLGEDFRTAVLPLFIMSSAVLVSSALGPSAVILNMSNMEKLVSRSSTMSLLVIVCIGPVLIINYEAVGAATTYAISLIVSRFLNWVHVHKHVSIDSSLFGSFITLLRR